MEKSEFAFMVLSAVLTTLVAVLTNEFLPFPIFFPLWIFVCIFLFVGFWEALRRGKAFVRVAFLVFSLVLTLFTGGLLAGAFEAIELSSESRLEISYGSTVLQVRNIGLSHAEIRTITVGEITYDVSMFRGGALLSRGGNALLTIKYGQGIYSYGETSSNYSFYLHGYHEEKLVSDANVTPSTYAVEGEYPVVIRTRFKEYHFQIEGNLSAVENLDILEAEAQGEMRGTNIYLRVIFRLNNTGLTPIFVHSVQIEDMTFMFYPSIIIPHHGWEMEPPIIILRLWSDGRITCYPGFYPYLYGQINVEVEPELNLSAFSPFNSYKVVFWTLTNKSYETSMTVLPGP